MFIIDKAPFLKLRLTSYPILFSYPNCYCEALIGDLPAGELKKLELVIYIVKFVSLNIYCYYIVSPA